MSKRFKKLKLSQTKKHKWYKENVIVFLLCLLALSSLTIGYAALNQGLDITGNVIVRADNDVRITGISTNQEQTTCGTDVFSPGYTVDTITTNLNLPALDCVIVYNLSIRNRGTKYIEITDIIEEVFNNPNMVYEFSNLSIGNIIYPNTTQETTLTFRYGPGVNTLPSNTNLGAIIRLVWLEHQTKPGGNLIVGESIDFPYNGTNGSNGSTQTFVVPTTGYYWLQVWGAQGGGTRNTAIGGNGGFSEGVAHLTAGTVVHVTVGGRPAAAAAANASQGAAGFNGGGQGGRGNNSSHGGSGGGGATHMSLSPGLLNNTTARNNILLVAGAGGGSAGASQSTHGGAGGGITGINGGVGFNTGGGPGGGGTQNSGGTGGIAGTAGCSGGTFLTGIAGGPGQGGGPVTAHGTAGPNSGAGNGGGGGGWFGGGSSGNCAPGSGGGGSGHLSSIISSNNLVTARTIPGNQPMPAPNGNTVNGNTNHGFGRITFLEPETPANPYDIGHTWTFDHNGAIQSIELYPGRYRLEVWGASGGGTHGGRGGFSQGEVSLTAMQDLYITVGGAGGVPASAAPGGFNGGGRSGGFSASNGSGGGGGATHIATRTGTLETLNDFRTDIWLVAGGGGGNGANNGINSPQNAGGAGGGANGISGLGTGIHGTGRPGTQNSGGVVVTTDARIIGTNGSFGRGGDCMGNTTGGGGGSGWFGGAHGGWEGGGGGSSFLNTILTNASTIAGNQTMPNPTGGTMTGRTGHGFVRITLLEH